MAAKTAARRRSGYVRGKGTHPAPAVRWGRWLGFGVALVAVVVVGWFVIKAATHRTSEDPAVTVLARENAGGTAIEVLTGPNHTVYHSSAALPTPSAPRADGKPTLVWFSATTCHFCQQMQPFAHQTAQQFTDRLVFVEKGLEKAGSEAARYGIRGTPTFVLIDARGAEIARFGFQSSAPAFTQAIAAAIQRARPARPG